MLTTRSSRGAAMAAGVLGALLLVGCANEPIDGAGALPSITLPVGGGDGGGEGGDGSDGSDAAPVTTAAPATTAPPAAPATTTAPQPAPADPDNAEQDGLSGEDWLLLALIAGAVVAVVAVVSNGSARHGQRRAQTETDRRLRLDSIVGNCRWLHDHASLELMGIVDAGQLSSTWPTMRQRIVGAEADIASLAATDARLGAQLSTLGRSVGAVRSSLEAYVGFRTKPETAEQASLISAATDSVIQARRELSSALGSFATAPV